MFNTGCTYPVKCENNIEYRKKNEKNEDSLRDFWENTPTFTLQGSQKKKRKRKDPRKY